MGTAVKHPKPDQVKPSLVIFDIRVLWRSTLSIRVHRCQKLQMMASPSLAQDALYLYPYGNSGCQMVLITRLIVLMSRLITVITHSRGFKACFDNSKQASDIYDVQTV